MSEVEEAISRIKTRQSVKGLVIVNKEGNIIRSTYTSEKDKHEAEALAKAIPSLTEKAHSTIRDLEANNELIFLRVKSKNNEILIAPDKDFILIVVQGRAQKKDDQEQI